MTTCLNKCRKVSIWNEIKKIILVVVVVFPNLVSGEYCPVSVSRIKIRVVTVPTLEGTFGLQSPLIGVAFQAQFIDVTNRPDSVLF